MSDKQIEREVMSLFRKRDLAIVSLVLIAGYIAWDSNSLFYQFEPAWYIDKRKDTNLLSGLNIPPPIITDLDGDNKKELIIVTNKGHLKVIAVLVELFVLALYYFTYA